MVISIYDKIQKLEKSGQSGILCTIVSTQGSTPRREGSKMLVYQDGKSSGTIGGGEMENRVIGEALEALSEGKPRLIKYSMVDPDRGDPGVCGGQLQIYIEPIMPKKTIVIIGGGHVGKAVTHLGKWLGFRVAVCDDRPDVATPDSVPEADQYYSDPITAIQQEIEITAWNYFVLTTRSVDVDVSILPAILDREPGYIGVIGSRRRWATTRTKLLEIGIPEDKIDLIHSPIGLDLNAETPEEIAVSIIAEILMVIKRGDGKHMSSVDIVVNN
jgi:xanthine dehydrogenase accessory factor